MLGFIKIFFAPKEVATAPANAWSNISVLKDGRIRNYGSYPRVAAEKNYVSYIESLDGGLSWKEHILPEGALGNSYYFDELGLYMRGDFYDGKVLVKKGKNQDEKPDEVIEIDLGGLNGGYGARHMIKLQNKNRYCFMVYCTPNSDSMQYTPVFVYSDDNGETWNMKKLQTLGRVPMGPRDKGERWQNYAAEPAFVEFSDGTLYCLVRTSHYVFYQCYSFDGGDTWTDLEPSPFHAFATMPNLQRLSDGRVLISWSNSMPLAETDHSEESMSFDEPARNGVWEDVFTNRDVLTCAITEDNGKTWKGFREIALASIRNSNYFRSHGGIEHGYDDKSLHQSQIIEMPYNKLLFGIGQHEVLRPIFLVDIDWLYETEREDDLRNGLENFSTQLYVKSVLGSFKGFSGHASYNRTHGAMMVPDNVHEEAMLIRRIPDELLVSDIQGAVWNYPLLKEGKVTVKYKVKARV